LVEIDETLSREEQGRKGVQALAAAGWPCDAIFAACDEIALGALEELRHLGKRVPDEIGLIGFDGNRGGAHSSPPLTSIEPDFESAGTMLVNKLLALIAGEDSDQRRVSVRLLERESTRRG
jgi:DNA-binding LacI/PurR family transcriptional regulator